MVEIVRGKEVTIRFDASLCVHSRNCVLSHPEVFVPNVKGEWIYPDAASVETVMLIGLTRRERSASAAMTARRPRNSRQW